MTRVRPPGFIICGAQRCGTTALWTLLDSHPEIHMARPVLPEPKFFSSPAIGKGYEWYLGEYFQVFDEGVRVSGEKSVTYMDTEFAAKNIHLMLPRVKLVFILRNPADRVWSHYLYSTKHLLEGLPFRDAIMTGPLRDRKTPEFLRVTRPWAYIDRSRYATKLTPFLKMFSRSQIHVVFYERFFTNLKPEADRLCDFIGVERFARYLPAEMARINASDADAPTLGDADRQFLTELFLYENIQLAEMLGTDLPDEWSL